MKYKYYLHQEAQIARVYRTLDGIIEYWSVAEKRWVLTSTYRGAKSAAFKHDIASHVFVQITEQKSAEEIEAQKS